MKRALLILAVGLVLAATASCQQIEYIRSPITIEWNQPSVPWGTDYWDVALLATDEAEPQIIAQPAEQELYVDLEALGLVGAYAVLVRHVAVTVTDYVFDVSEWARSDNDGDVILVDDEPRVFVIYLERPAEKPTVLRVR